MSKTYYMRVRPWGVGSLRAKLPHTKVCGVVKFNPYREEAKVKINNCWLEWVHNECKFHGITKAEFDTDLAFELWPELPIKYCPQWWWRIKVSWWSGRAKVQRKYYVYAPVTSGLVALAIIALIIVSVVP